MFKVFQGINEEQYIILGKIFPFKVWRFKWRSRSDSLSGMLQKVYVCT